MALLPADLLFAERWVPDFRLGDKYQIQEVFYTKDQGAFDKGHIVRRDDVAWGRTPSWCIPSR